MAQLRELLAGYEQVAIDTSPFIYYIEENEQYVGVADILFDLVAKGRLTAVTSVVTLIEVLIQPLKLTQIHRLILEVGCPERPRGCVAFTNLMLNVALLRLRSNRLGALL